MEVFDAVRTVLAVRSYQDRAIPVDALNRIVEAGHLTASASNKQPWHFVVVQNRDTLRQLGSLAPTGPYIAGAQAAIVVAVEKTPFAVSDASRAIQDMILTAWSEGVGSNWVGFAGGRLDAVRTALGIPDEYDVLTILPLGYPDKSIGRGKKNRKPPAQIASRERFGQPYQ